MNKKLLRNLSILGLTSSLLFGCANRPETIDEYINKYSEKKGYTIHQVTIKIDFANIINQATISPKDTLIG